jgi:hypothetical protein
MKTRTKGSTKTVAEAIEVTKSTIPKVQLGPESANPPQLFIVPEDISTEARIVSLENPRYLKESRYLVCPERGFFEFTRVSAPKTTPRSWLLSPHSNQEGKESLEVGTGAKAAPASKGYVTKSANLFTATPIDPLYLVLPALAPLVLSKGSEPTKRLFLSGEDYLDRIASASPESRGLLKEEYVRTSIEGRMAAVCDTVEAGDETMYRLSEAKLLSELLQKAKKMIEKGLPASIEEKLVRKALEVPMLSIKREESFIHELGNEKEVTPIDSDIPATQTTVSSTETAASSFSEASEAATSISEDASNIIICQKSKIEVPQISAPNGVADLLRLRTALFFIFSNYIAPHLSDTLKKTISSPASPTDFSSLDTHLTHLTKLRQEALAARSLDDFSRKRSLGDDHEAETRAEKKQKMEEEEKRKKAGESRGVKNLKKVNVSGMKKMSDFFKKR